ncbi:MAG: (d)CMP kinase [Methylococcaceae bacterium]|nr:(d)CMP kinase [Methylococcaceae bacterium]
MTIPVLTIDGPSGAGKGSVSRAIAQQLDWHYLDSGSIYRSLAIAVLQQGIDLQNVPAIAAAAVAMTLKFECAAILSVRLAGVDITAQLSAEETGLAASIIAAYSDVRAVLLQKQRDFQQAPGLVADGRDMGTVVFPEAPYKIYLTASAEMRALRRYKQLKEKGIDANLTQITIDIEERDRRDRERATAPLMIAEGALYIDSSTMTLDQVIAEVTNLIR